MLMPFSAFAQEAEAVPAISGTDTSWLLISTALVLLMPSWAGILLRGTCPFQECTQHHDDELCRAGGFRHAVGHCRVFHCFWGGECLDR